MSWKYLVVEDPADVPASVIACRAFGFTVVYVTLSPDGHSHQQWVAARRGLVLPVGTFVTRDDVTGVPDYDGGGYGNEEVFAELIAWRDVRPTDRQFSVNVGYSLVSVRMADRHERIDVTGVVRGDDPETSWVVGQALHIALMRLSRARTREADREKAEIASSMTHALETPTPGAP